MIKITMYQFLFHNLSIFLLLLLFLNIESSFALTISRQGDDYLVDNKIFSALLSNETGMVESMKINGTDFEIVSDYPSYSLFFVEFVYEFENGINFKFDHPDDWDNNDITVKLRYYDDVIAVFDVVYKTGLIDGYWQFFFEDSVPYIRARLTREVKKSGLYSNFQQCTMYNSDMDNSFIVNYKGNIELTMGKYEGDFEYVCPFRGGVDYSVRTSQHSMWTVFDYGDPKYFPFMAWSDDESGVYAGAIMTYSSPNQRETISYHGGGSTMKHPGFAEAQWNWFGKSDAESLYLQKGMKFCMELVFYQNHGNIDSLFTFANQLLDNESGMIKKSINYSTAHWGGRSSEHDNYYWRFPQAGNNSITSQELWNYKSFSVPRSQNGIWDIHLFSIDLFSDYQGRRLNMSPIDGSQKVFDHLDGYQNENKCMGEIGWMVENIPSVLQYYSFTDRNSIQISGSFGNSETSNMVALPLSSRTDSVLFLENNTLVFFTEDAVLDTVSIILYNMKNISNYSLVDDTLWLTPESLDFQFELCSGIQTIPRNSAELAQRDFPSDIFYKENFQYFNYKSGISTLPAMDYYIYNIDKNEFMLYAVNDFDSLFIKFSKKHDNVFILGEDFQPIAPIFTDDGITLIDFPFYSGTTYYISTEEPVDKGNNELSVILYSNPISNELKIGIEEISRSGQGNVSIYNILGQKVLPDQSIVLRKNILKQKIIPIKNLQNGIYFLKVNYYGCTRSCKFTVIH